MIPFGLNKILGSQTINLETGEIIDDSLIDCFGGGGKGGYSGPSAAEMEMQRNMYRQQWEAEKEAQRLEAEEAKKKAEEKAAKEEIESRRGVKDILANSQIGFTKKLKDDKTEEEENVLGGLM